MKIENLVRDNIRNLKPYASARSLYDGSEATLLDANENGTDRFGSSLNRYPDPLQKELKKLIAGIKEVEPTQIFLGNGSDEAIDLLFRIFCEPGKDEIIICPPTYGMYKVQAQINHVAIKKVLLNGVFDLQVNKIMEVVTNRTKMLFLCSPNNPTGNLLDPNKIRYLIENFPGIVVVDEAYIDYAGVDSFSRLIGTFPNLIVLQTFSKAWALAGARLGMAFANQEIIHYLNSVKFPYNINQLTQERVLQVLKKEGQHINVFTDNQTRKSKLEKELNALSFVEKIYPSAANFLLVKMKNANGLFNYLKSKKIIVRDRSNEPLCEGCLRITIGTDMENALLMEALKSWSV